jgi:1-phosphofructokinase family hexose kinase
VTLSDSSRHEFDIVIASPNTAVDSYYPLPQLEIGTVNRSEQVLHTAGGKGNNMARAAARLGGRVLSLGIVGGTSGQLIVGDLEKEGIAFDMVWTSHETRRCVTVPALNLRQTTVVLESGGPTGEEARHHFADKIRAHAGCAPFLTLNGSLPPDFPDDFYATVIRDLAESGIRVCLDTAGEPLRLGAEAGPAIIKINREEFASAFTSSRDWPSAAGVFDRLHEQGLELLIITDGPRGAYVFAPEIAPFRVLTPVETWISTAGAGDTFMAALLLALERDETVEQAARFASAAAVASLQQVVCGALRLDDVHHYLELTTLEPIPDVS